MTNIQRRNYLKFWRHLNVNTNTLYILINNKNIMAQVVCYRHIVIYIPELVQGGGKPGTCQKPRFMHRDRASQNEAWVEIL